MDHIVKSMHAICTLLDIAMILCLDFIHNLHNYFAGTGAILQLVQCQWYNPEEYV